MAGLLSNEPTHEGPFRASQERSEEGGGRWYFNRKEIEEDSPSRSDGIDLKKETYLRKSYCTFLQDLGMRLKVPQVTIATAIIFCHRFFLRQSHAKNDRRTIATVCMFLAGKVEETPRLLKDVILVSYEIIHKKDAGAVQRIKQKEVYEQQKELILLGERMVLTTLGFDLNVHHPYKPLVEAIKKFQVAQNALAQVAWNFVNDGLRTSLCLQFKPHHIAAGAIFLAAKFLKVKLPSDGEKVWWQEFDVTPRQLEEVSNQMLELYEQNRVPQSQPSEAEGSGGATTERPLPKPAPPSNEEHRSSHTSRSSSLKPPPPPKPVPDQSHASNNNHSGPHRISQTRNNDDHSETNSIKEEDEEREQQHNPSQDDDDQEGHSGQMENNRDSNNNITKVEVKDKKLDREKLKAAFARRKALGDITRKVDPMDELERELEDVELPHEKKSISSDRDEFDGVEEGEVEFSEDVADRGYQSPKSSSHKRKHGSPLDGKQRSDYGQGFVKQNGYGAHKRHLQENHV